MWFRLHFRSTLHPFTLVISVEVQSHRSVFTIDISVLRTMAGQGPTFLSGVALLVSYLPKNCQQWSYRAQRGYRYCFSRFQLPL